MKCLTGFVSSITLNIIIHKTNNQYTASFTISFEWQRMWPSWQQKKKEKDPYFHLGLSDTSYQPEQNLYEILCWILG